MSFLYGVSNNFLMFTKLNTIKFSVCNNICCISNPFVKVREIGNALLNK